MKKILTVLLMCAFSSYSFAQVESATGAGAGTSGGAAGSAAGATGAGAGGGAAAAGSAAAGGAAARRSLAALPPQPGRARGGGAGG